MAKTQRRDDEPTRPRRVRGALAPLGRASAAATACILWVGLALPGLQLLPGASGFGNRSIAISLQSALLGIDNGYASTPEARAAIQRVARLEGIFLDPVYTAKAMAGLIDLAGRGIFPPGSTVLFWHTGGAPGIFGFPQDVVG